MTQKQEPSIPEELYACFIGKNINDYLPVFQKFIAAGKFIPSINWGAIFFGPAWFLFRKMSAPGLIYMALSYLIYSDFLFSFFWVERHFSFRQSKFIVFFIYFLVAAFISVFANYLYFMHTNKHLTQIINEPGITDKKATAEARGGTSMAYILACMPLIILLRLNGII